ncbi:MAG: hypothetical protein K0R17_518 [Rariglobus sp.]|jgi:autotransporter-associated beta strand protein|nr:hypothetical protein [Rariglobus sp.]
MNPGFIRPVANAPLRRFYLLASLSSVLAIPAGLHAASSTWSNSGGTDFQTAGNWSAGVPGVTGTSNTSNADIATFGGTSVANPNVSANWTLAQLLFNTTASGYDITSTGGFSLRLNNSTSAIVAQNTSGTNTISSAIILGRNGSFQNFSQAAGGTLIVNGKISSATTAGINFLNSTTSPAGTTAEFQINNTANDFSGGAVIGTSGRNVKVSIKSLGNTGAAGSLGTGSIIIGETGASSTVQTLNYTGAGETSNKTITLRASSNAANRRVIDTTGATGALKLSGSLVANDTSLSTETANVQLSGSGTLGDEVTGVIGNGAGAGKVALIKAGAGTWTLSGNNTYTGTTTVSEGTLALGAANRIADASNLVLSGGTFATGGFGETLGTLSLTANSTIDLGSGASALVFSASNGIAWTSLTTLNIVNFNTGTDSVRIGTSAAGLTETQLSQITINGFEALIDSQGYLSFAAIPEPSTYAVMLGGLALAGVMIRRRRC